MAKPKPKPEPQTAQSGNQGGVIVVPKDQAQPQAQQPQAQQPQAQQPQAQPAQWQFGGGPSSGTASGYGFGNSTGTVTHGGTAYHQAEGAAGAAWSGTPTLQTPTPSPVNKGLSPSRGKSGIPDGFYVAYEDENYYYCLPRLTNEQRMEIVSKLEAQIPTGSGSQIRREAIRLANCMVEKNAQYKEGATIEEFLADCEKAAAQPTDCSSLVQWVHDSAACIVNGFCMAADRKRYFKAQRTSSDQYKMFHENGALTLTPEGAGDEVFLKEIDESTNKIKHVGIFLFSEGDVIWMIHASSSAKHVVIAPFTEKGFKMRIVGYGNLEKLLR
jgi:hypothetical protein